MKASDLEKFTDKVFKWALNKSLNTFDAQDLAQETLLSALNALHKGAMPEKPEAWLASIMQRRFYDLMRQKYKYPTTSFDDLPFINNNTDSYEGIIKSLEAEDIRCQLAHMVKIYREVVVRYYMQGKGINQIADELGIPRGTVLSRLDSGRKQVKKGVENMDYYSKNSYQPEILKIGIDGRVGLKHEPFTAVQNKLQQNILLRAYEKPVTEKEIADNLGISLVFIEELVEQLVDAELMKRTGNRVYTDFIISSVEDKMKALTLQKKAAAKTFDGVWSIIVESARKISGIPGFRICNTTHTIVFMAIEACHAAIRKIREDFYYSRLISYDDYPVRPNGGKWFAMGGSYPADYKDEDNELREYQLSGRLNSTVSDFDGMKYIRIYDWDSFIGSTHSCYQNLKYSLMQPELAKMLYFISVGKKIEENQMELIPDLERLNIVETLEGKTIIKIPILTEEEHQQFDSVINEAGQKISIIINETVKQLYSQASLGYPANINVPVSIPAGLYTNYIPMSYIYLARDKGLIKIEKIKKYPVMLMVVN